MIYLLPGASATGRDFLLEQLLAHKAVVGERIGLGRPLNIEVIKKTTTRPSRTGVELLKVCVAKDEFDKGLEAGTIIAPYVLESNGHQYGYHRSSLESATENVADIMISDASVYQVPELKREFGERVYTAAMVATRKYREDNLKIRGSENPQEMVDRLNLGDAHVAIALLMSGRHDISYHDFVPAHFAGMVSNLISAQRNGLDTAKFERQVEDYSKSRIVVDTIKNLATDNSKYVDELAILSDEHRVAPGSALPVTETKFFDMGVGMVNSALKAKNRQYQVS